MIEQAATDAVDARFANPTTITGAKEGNAALESLISALVVLGLIVDATDA